MDCRGFLRNLAMTGAWQSRPGTGRGHCEPRQGRGNPEQEGPRSLRASTEAWQSRQERAAVIASLGRGVAIQTRNGPRSLRASTEAWQPRPGTGRGHCEPRQRRGNPAQERAAVIASLDRGVAIQTRNGPRSLRASTEAWQSTSFTASRGRGPAPSGNRDTCALALSVSDPYKMTLQNEREKKALVPPAKK